MVRSWAHSLAISSKWSTGMIATYTHVCGEERATTEKERLDFPNCKLEGGRIKTSECTNLGLIDFRTYLRGSDQCVGEHRAWQQPYLLCGRFFVYNLLCGAGLFRVVARLNP